MATHSNILGLKNPMDRVAWQATVHGVTRVGHDLENKERERERMFKNKPNATTFLKIPHCY